MSKSQPPTTVTPIPSLAFPRGSVVRQIGGGPNMLVVRGYPDRTVAVVITGQTDGHLRLKDFPTHDLEQLLESGTPATDGLEPAKKGPSEQ